MYNSYSPPAPAQNNFWHPSVMGQPAVAYPDMTFGQQPTPAKHGLAQAMAVDRNAGQAMANARMAQGYAGVNNAFDWGGNKTVGADSRGFPNVSGVPNNYQMSMGGSGMMGGGGASSPGGVNNLA